MYRYRLIDENGTDLGPLISARLEFTPGETIAREPGDGYVLVRVVEPENENFRAYLVVRRQ